MPPPSCRRSLSLSRSFTCALSLSSLALSLSLSLTHMRAPTLSHTHIYGLSLSLSQSVRRLQEGRALWCQGQRQLRCEHTCVRPPGTAQSRAQQHGTHVRAQSRARRPGRGIAPCAVPPPSCRRSLSLSRSFTCALSLSSLALSLSLSLTHMRAPTLSHTHIYGLSLSLSQSVRRLQEGRALWCQGQRQLRCEHTCIPQRCRYSGGSHVHYSRDCAGSLQKLGVCCKQSAATTI